MSEQHDAQLPDAAPPWRILIVDDEPGVHDVTRMLLGRMVFGGRRVQLDSAASGAEALAWLQAHPETALVLLDVVMETDDAGLRLVDEIRHDLGNRDVQIVLRTGQPGQAPEREVMLNYDINGYFLKTEVTARKLNSIIVAALRSHAYIQTLKSRRESVAATSRTAPEPQLASVVEQPFAFEVQPQFDLHDGRIDRFVLAPRWASAPTLDWRRALPFATAQALNRRLLQAAAAVHADWQSRSVTPSRIALPLGFDPAHADALLVDLLEKLPETGLPGTDLQLELAESQLPRDTPVDSAVLARLRASGPTLAVDRFGSDRTALAQLRQLRPEQLKIDRSLIAAMLDDPDSAAITRSVIALAHTLGMTVVADGVETGDQYQFLQWEGCELARGRYFAPVLSPRDVPGFLAD
jgi:EAL domain-containing protein (putative c-di-GMP-specific phosphodiesterase class I)